jgi:hypothetical protein
MPVKDFHTRIKPSTLASGHGRHTTVAPERTLVLNGRCYMQPLQRASFRPPSWALGSTMRLKIT